MSHDLNSFIIDLTDLIEDRLDRQGLSPSTFHVSQLYEWAIDRARRDGFSTSVNCLISNRQSIINRILLDLRTR